MAGFALDGLVVPAINTKKGKHRKSVSVRTKRDAQAEARSDFDTQLMLQVCEGNAEAGNTLLRRNFDRVARYIARVVRDQRPIEDLAQDVFLQVLKKAKTYEPTAKFSTWLYRIATNTSLNYIKQAYIKKRREHNPDLDEPVIVDRSGRSPEREVSLDELRGQVSAAISSLPVRQRIALTLFEYEELSYEQIATVLGTNVGSVRSLLKRARQGLRAKLGGLV